MDKTIEDVLKKHLPGMQEHFKDKFPDIHASLLKAMTEWASLNRQGWVLIEKDKSESMPPDCTVVLGYNEKWADEDFEPEGIRECFYSEAMESWNSAKWNNDQDTWFNDDETAPTHWMQRPGNPSESSPIEPCKGCEGKDRRISELEKGLEEMVEQYEYCANDLFAKINTTCEREIDKLQAYKSAKQLLNKQ